MAIELPELVGKVRIDTSGVDKATKKIGKSGIAVGAAAGALAAGAIQKAADAVAGFVGDSLGKFEAVGKEVISLGRVIGGTTEEVSRLRFAAQQSGVSVDGLKVGFKSFSKEIAGSGKGLKALKVDTKNADGSLRSTNDVLLDVADRFKAMPDGAAKSAMAVKLFGRNGLQMLPMLSKGKDGIKELMDQTDEYGQLITGQDSKAIKDHIGAQRRLTAAMDGAKIVIGRALLPIMTKLTEGFVKLALKAQPVVKTIVNGFERLWDAAAPLAGPIFDTIKQTFTDIGTALGTLFGKGGAGTEKLVSFGDSLKTVGDILTTTFKPVLDQVVKGLSEELQPTLKAVKDYFNSAFIPVFNDLVTLFKTQLWPLIQSMAGLWTKTLIPALQAVWNFITQSLLPVVAGLVNVIRVTLMPIITAVVQVFRTTVIPIVQTLVDAFVKNVLPALTSLFNKLQTEVMPVLMRVGGILGAWISILIRVAGVILKTVLPPLIRFIGPILGALIRVLGWVLGFAFKLIGKFLDLGSVFKNLPATIKNFVQSALDKVGQLWTFLKELPAKVLEKIGNLGSTLFESGKSLVQGLLDGVKSLGSKIGSFFLDLLPAWIREPFKKALGIASPSKVFAGYGRNIGQGLVNGITQSRGAVAGAVGNLVQLPALPSMSVAGVNGAVRNTAGNGPLAASSTTNINVTAYGSAAATPAEVARAIAWQQRVRSVA